MRTEEFRRRSVVTHSSSSSRMQSHFYIQLYSPECTLAENININSNKQNKDTNILKFVDLKVVDMLRLASAKQQLCNSKIRQLTS